MDWNRYKSLDGYKSWTNVDAAISYKKVMKTIFILFLFHLAVAQVSTQTTTTTKPTTTTAKPPTNLISILSSTDTLISDISKPDLGQKQQGYNCPKNYIYNSVGNNCKKNIKLGGEPIIEIPSDVYKFDFNVAKVQPVW